VINQHLTICAFSILDSNLLELLRLLLSCCSILDWATWIGCS